MSNVIHVVTANACALCVFYKPQRKSKTFGICKCARVCGAQIPLPGIRPTLLKEGEKK